MAIEAVATLVPERGAVVEVGSLFGRSSWAWAKSVHSSVTVHCIDPWERNEGVRNLEARHGITYGIEQFRKYTADCPNIRALKGYSPVDFQDWSRPIDLYYEDAVHTDPILARNLDFWASKLTPAGIACGDDYRPRFPDVVNGARRLADRLGRELIRVDHFWCLLPGDDLAPGASAVAERLKELSDKCDAAKRAQGAILTIGPIEPIQPVAQGTNPVVACRLYNGNIDPWPSKPEGALTAGVRITRDEARDVVVAEATTSLNCEQLPADIPFDLDFALPAVSLQPGKYRAVFDVLGADGRYVSHPDTGKPNTATTFDIVAAKAPTPVDAPPGDTERACLEAAPMSAKTFPDQDRGDWPRAEHPTPPERPKATMDDVVRAYHWILGREPESATTITNHLKATRMDRHALRLRILRSPEFAAQLDRWDISSTSEQEAIGAIPSQDEAPTRPIIFIHIPKTGGSSLHHHLAQSFDPKEISGYRRNTLHRARLFELAGKRLFSGHYDSRVLQYLPRDSIIVTMLREPRSRLISLYQYLRATSADRAISEAQTLAQLARTVSFEEFLARATELNAGTVDNVYTRTFGSALPVARWERSAEPAWTKRYGKLTGDEYRDALARAKTFLQSVAAVGIVEEFDATARRILMACNVPIPQKFVHFKNINAIDSQTVGFDPVEKIEPKASEILMRLTKYDTELYEHARNMLAKKN